MISPTQYSFVPRRHITDNIVIVQEMLHTMCKNKGASGYMVIKIDFEKAYDRLRLNFIWSTLLARDVHSSKYVGSDYSMYCMYFIANLLERGTYREFHSN